MAAVFSFSKTIFFSLMSVFVLVQTSMAACVIPSRIEAIGNHSIPFKMREDESENRSCPNTTPLIFFFTVIYKNATRQTVSGSSLTWYNGTYRQLNVSRRADWGNVVAVDLHANVTFNMENYSIIFQWAPECEYKAFRTRVSPNATKPDDGATDTANYYRTRFDIVPQNPNRCRPWNFSIDGAGVKAVVRRADSTGDDIMISTRVANQNLRFQLTERRPDTIRYEFEVAYVYFQIYGDKTNCSGIVDVVGREELSFSGLPAKHCFRPDNIIYTRTPGMMIFELKDATNCLLDQDVYGCRKSELNFDTNLEGGADGNKWVTEEKCKQFQLRNSATERVNYMASAYQYKKVGIQRAYFDERYQFHYYLPNNTQSYITTIDHILDSPQTTAFTQLLFEYNLNKAVDAEVRDFSYCNSSESQLYMEMTIPGEYPRIYPRYFENESLMCVNIRGAYVQLSGIYQPPGFDHTQNQGFDVAYVTLTDGQLPQGAGLPPGSSVIYDPIMYQNSIGFSFGSSSYNYLKSIKLQFNGVPEQVEFKSWLSLANCLDTAVLIQNSDPTLKLYSRQVCSGLEEATKIEGYTNTEQNDTMIYAGNADDKFYVTYYTKNADPLSDPNKFVSIVTPNLKILRDRQNVNNTNGIDYNFGDFSIFNYVSEDEANKRLADLATYESFNYGFDQWIAKNWWILALIMLIICVISIMMMYGCKYPCYWIVVTPKDRKRIRGEVEKELLHEAQNDI